MLSGISITCFAASYAVTLLLEISRLFFRLSVRLLVMVGFAVAGLLAHTIYLAAIARDELSGGEVAPLSSWYDWCLMASWVLAAIYIVLTVSRPQNAVGLFLLPLVLSLIGLAMVFQNVSPFPRHEALSYWRMIHGFALLVGTASVTLGFAAGVMYLVQSYRLKHKLPPRQGFKLPSLEWLQQLNRLSLFVSTCLLGLGLLSGIVLNLLNVTRRAGTVAWSDPVVWTSGILFLWLMAAMLFEAFYKPARQGRKVAYLTLASFIFLGFVLGSVLLGRHASADSEEASASHLQLVMPVEQWQGVRR